MRTSLQLQRLVIMSVLTLAVVACGSASRAVVGAQQNTVPSLGSEIATTMPLPTAPPNSKDNDPAVVQQLGFLLGEWHLETNAEPSDTGDTAETVRVSVFDSQPVIELAGPHNGTRCNLFASFFELRGNEVRTVDGLAMPALECLATPSPTFAALISDLQANKPGSMIVLGDDLEIVFPTSIRYLFTRTELGRAEQTVGG
jgi:hypothetical protein